MTRVSSEVAEMPKASLRLALTAGSASAAIMYSSPPWMAANREE